jgi:putative transposase
VDVTVVDERERLPIGRPWLSLAIDVASRAVTGFYVALDAPSVVSVAMVLTRYRGDPAPFVAFRSLSSVPLVQAVLPKETWLADRNIDIVWPVAGIPDLLHVDNGPDFDSDALARGCEEYGIDLKQRPVRRPHYGGHIERLIGTMMGAVHMLPGTTFSNVEEKADYPSEKTACLT